MKYDNLNNYFKDNEYYNNIKLNIYLRVFFDSKNLYFSYTSSLSSDLWFNADYLERNHVISKGINTDIFTVNEIENHIVKGLISYYRKNKLKQLYDIPLEIREIIFLIK